MGLTAARNTGISRCGGGGGGARPTRSAPSGWARRPSSPSAVFRPGTLRPPR